ARVRRPHARLLPRPPPHRPPLVSPPHASLHPATPPSKPSGYPTPQPAPAVAAGQVPTPQLPARGHRPPVQLGEPNRQGASAWQSYLPDTLNYDPMRRARDEVTY